jgi:uncharacterized membrane protein YeaQ/YmgE (transglycosylase-associated protein family)
MTFLTYLIGLLIGGLIIGALARLALPGKDPMSIPMTIAIGIGGTFVAGMILALIGAQSAGGWLLSLIAATGIVYLVRRSRGGGLMDPGAPPGLDR